RRPGRVAHIAMPVFAGAPDPDRLAALCNVGDNHDLRAARHAPAFAEDVEFDLAKAAREGNLLWWRDVLVAKENDAVLVVGPLDRGERGIIERSGEIGAADLGAQSGAGRYDLERHRTSYMRACSAVILPQLQAAE